MDCLLLSPYPVDSIFETKARAYAAINNYRVSLSVPAQCTDLFPSGLIGPNGQSLVQAGGTAELVVEELDRDSPALDIALNYTRPWRTVARAGEIYEDRRVTDARSQLRTAF